MDEEWVHTYVWHTPTRYVGLEHYANVIHPKMRHTRLGATIKRREHGPLGWCNSSAVHGFQFWDGMDHWMRPTRRTVHLCVLSSPLTDGFRTGTHCITSAQDLQVWPHTKLAGHRRTHLVSMSAKPMRDEYRRVLAARTTRVTHATRERASDAAEQVAYDLLVERGFDFPLEWGAMTITKGPEFD